MPRLVQRPFLCALLSGCFGAGEGLEAPADQIYFPVGLALDASSKHLFVVSSDFDLQYNGGAIQSYRIEGGDGIWGNVPHPCVASEDCEGGQECNAGLCAPAGKSPCATGEHSEAERLLYPSRCDSIDPKPLSQASVKIGAFATDVVIRSNPEAAGAERLFIPVRGDTTLHWLDVADGDLECGQAGHDDNCDANHRRGQSSDVENSRGINLAAEPFAIDANEQGTTIVVTNQTTGTASAFVNEWANGVNGGPSLRHALSGSNIPSRPVGIAALPSEPPADGGPAFDTFLMTFRNSAQVRLIRFAGAGNPADPADEEVADPDRPYLIDGNGVAIDANSVGSDSRGIATDPSARKQALAACQEGDEACRAAALLVPVDVYVANRAPASLLIGRTRPPLDYPYFFQSLPLTVGPSRVVVGKVKTPGGEEAEETRVFVVCFDSRRIFVYDPKRARFETEIWTGRGPHAVAVDTEHSLLYVGHFTDSFVGVFSLDLRYPASYGTMLGTLGKPKAPRSSK